MPRPYLPYVPKNLYEVREKLSGMMIVWPRFENVTGYFPGRNIDTEFYELNEGLKLIRPKLGEELYLQLREMSDRMQAHFKADPETKTGDALKGRDILLEMIAVLKQAARNRRLWKNEDDI